MTLVSNVPMPDRRLSAKAAGALWREGKAARAAAVTRRLTSAPADPPREDR